MVYKFTEILSGTAHPTLTKKVVIHTIPSVGIHTKQRIGVISRSLCGSNVVTTRAEHVARAWITVPVRILVLVGLVWILVAISSIAAVAVVIDRVSTLSVLLLLLLLGVLIAVSVRNRVSPWVGISLAGWSSDSHVIARGSIAISFLYIFAITAVLLILAITSSTRRSGTPVVTFGPRTPISEAAFHLFRFTSDASVGNWAFAVSLFDLSSGTFRPRSPVGPFRASWQTTGHKFFDFVTHRTTRSTSFTALTGSHHHDSSLTARSLSRNRTTTSAVKTTPFTPRFAKASIAPLVLRFRFIAVKIFNTRSRPRLSSPTTGPIAFTPSSPFWHAVALAAFDCFGTGLVLAVALHGAFTSSGFGAFAASGWTRRPLRPAFHVRAFKSVTGSSLGVFTSA